MLQKNWDRKNKNIMRRIAIQRVGAKLKTILMLPSHSCLDLKSMLEKGFIGRNTYVIAVEFNPKNVPSIRNFLKKHFNDFAIFEGAIEDFDLPELLGKRKIDFAFIDLCGLLKASVADWLYEVRHCFADGCRIPITLKLNQRNGKYLPAVKKISGHQIHPEVKELLQCNNNMLSVDNMKSGA